MTGTKTYISPSNLISNFRPACIILLPAAILLFLSAFPGPVIAFEGLPSPTPGWIPLEDDAVIARRQYPQYYPPPELLPDLRTLTPTDLQLEILRGDRVRRLRFSNTIWNSGLGPLEMRGVLAEEPGRVRVTQHIQRSDGTQILYDAGVFHYHAEHRHWHWEGFSIYQIWSVTPTGQLDELMIDSDKIGYCLIDVSRYDRPAENFNEDDLPVLQVPTTRQYSGCTWSRQGLSHGWTDTYRAHLYGQALEISHLPDGLYALQSIVDPDGIIREADYSNNAARVYFVLSGDQLEVVGERFVEPKPIQTPR